ncbi:type IIL restriction-modification enzyme MmeI [Cysteiniphilum litorale]|uniref:type IIL restriction-modification enzyme MmeI n=1 Tax=Cysteiniphilum litorale TaxID=2056700 RepID=UPI003F8824E2
MFKIEENIHSLVNNVTHASFVFNILNAQDAYVDQTFAQLYDPDNMPDNLRAAHHVMDEAIERCYCETPFESDQERLAYLFKLYEEMTAGENKNAK